MTEQEFSFLKTFASILSVRLSSGFDQKSKVNGDMKFFFDKINCFPSADKQYFCQISIFAADL